MPSDALLDWQTERTPRLQDIEADCLHLEGLYPANPDRVQEFIRAYAVLLSSEFQGFCRDLHDECAEKLLALVSSAALLTILRAQFAYGRKLETGNPNPGNLGADFGRYQIDFWPAILALDPAHAARRHRLALLNAWRNAIAHHNYHATELGGMTTLTILDVRAWRSDCDAFATAFDAVMREALLAVTGVAPWPP